MYLTALTYSLYYGVNRLGVRGESMRFIDWVRRWRWILSTHLACVLCGGAYIDIVIKCMFVCVANFLR